MIVLDNSLHKVNTTSPTEHLTRKISRLSATSHILFFWLRPSNNIQAIFLADIMMDNVSKSHKQNQITVFLTKCLFMDLEPGLLECLLVLSQTMNTEQWWIFISNRVDSLLSYITNQDETTQIYNLTSSTYCLTLLWLSAGKLLCANL